VWGGHAWFTKGRGPVHSLFILPPGPAMLPVPVGRPGCDDGGMSDLDWSTPEGLAAIRTHLAAQIEGWQPPVASAVALSPASSSPEWVLPHVNAPGGRHQLPAVVLATILGHDGSTASLPLSRTDLEAAVTSLAPAEACTAMEHPNLAAWRAVLHELAGNPAREAVAVFVADLGDPVTSEADASLRVVLEGGTPKV
jgi:hypothetical protein